MAEPAVVARGLVKSYGQGERKVPVLRGLDLEVAAGEFVVILGPSGSGKSTLLNLLGLMDSPDSGEVRLGGEAAGALDEAGRARLRGRRLGFVFQFDSLLPEFTALENVTMPARIAGAPLGEAEARGRGLLKGLGLAALEARLPTQLSGGERQRVALCRALVNAPSVLLADEPTGNLDKANGEMVFSDLRALSRERGVAVVMVTHNESARDYASRSLHMIDGAFREVR